MECHDDTADFSPPHTSQPTVQPTDNAAVTDWWKHVLDKEEAADNAAKLQRMCRISEEEQRAINKALSGSDGDTVGCIRTQIVKLRDFKTLEAGKCLNDEVLNLYMEVLQKEATERLKEDANNPRVLFMNTFFYEQLNGGQRAYKFKSVERWTRTRPSGCPVASCS